MFPLFVPLIHELKYAHSLNSRRTADGGEGLFSSTGSNRDNGATQMSKLRNMSVNGQTKPTNGRIVAVASNQVSFFNGHFHRTTTN